MDYKKWMVASVFILFLVLSVYFIFFKSVKTSPPVLNVGDKCSLDSECVSENCNFFGRGMACCPAGKDCCLSDSDCTQGALCTNYSKGIGICSGKKANGDTCKSQQQCASQNCVNGVCCLIGETCCANDDNCLGGGRCNMKNFYCQSLRAVGKSCGFNEDCISGNCNHDICCAEGNSCCFSDSDCEGGTVCDRAFYYCVDKK